MTEAQRRLIWFLWFVWLIRFIWLVPLNLNKPKKPNNDRIVLTDFSASCQAILAWLHLPFSCMLLSKPQPTSYFFPVRSRNEWRRLCNRLPIVRVVF